MCQRCILAVWRCARWRCEVHRNDGGCENHRIATRDIYPQTHDMWCIFRSPNKNVLTSIAHTRASSSVSRARASKVTAFWYTTCVGILICSSGASRTARRDSAGSTVHDRTNGMLRELSGNQEMGVRESRLASLHAVLCGDSEDTSPASRFRWVWGHTSHSFVQDRSRSHTSETGKRTHCIRNEDTLANIVTR
jgi:hypothetical protein